MEDLINTDFPDEFGESPEDFLKKYSHLIYKVINEKTHEKKRKLKSQKLEVEDLSNGFFILILKDNFKKLRRYRGEGAPHNYIRKILRNHICYRLGEERPKIKIRFELTDQSLEELKNEGIPENISNYLKELENKSYKSERRFTNAVTKILGEENTDAYKLMILCYAVFPKKFGGTPNGFLKKYGRLIYKIIYEKTRYILVLEIEELFNGFFIHISENYYKRLWQYRGECEPQSYLTKILRHFIATEIKKIIIHINREKPIDEVNVPPEQNREDVPTVADEDEDEAEAESRRKSNLIKEALKKTYSCLSHRERLIFKATYIKEWDSRKVANILGIRRGYVFETNEKVRNIFREKLGEREINIIKKTDKKRGEDRKKKKVEGKKRKKEKVPQILDASMSVNKTA